MTNTTDDWKRRAEAICAPLREIDRSWLPESLLENVKLLDAGMLGQTTRRIVYNAIANGSRRSAKTDFVLPVWAEQGPTSQRHTVLRLGALSSSTPIRHTIERSDLRVLRQVVDEEIYRQALTQEEALIRDDIDGAYWSALRAGDIQHFIAAMGMSVLQCAAPNDAAFIEQSARYLFSTKAWSLRRTDLVCDTGQVMKILMQVDDE